MSPPVSGGRSGMRGARSELAIATSAARAGSSEPAIGSSRATSVMWSPSASPTMTAAGSPATKEYRPHRSDRSTDSSSMPGPPPDIDGNNPTGVETSARSSVQTGTRGHPDASSSNVSRSGRICRSTACDLLRAANLDTERPRPGPGVRGVSVGSGGSGVRERRGREVPAPVPAVGARRHGAHPDSPSQARQRRCTLRA